MEDNPIEECNECGCETSDKGFSKLSQQVLEAYDREGLKRMKFYLDSLEQILDRVDSEAPTSEA